MKVSSNYAEHRKYFKEPLVMAKISQLRFPKVCPVCASSSTTLTRISAKQNSKQWLRPHWNPAFDASSKNFLLYVCEDHNVADEGSMRVRGLAMLLASILVGMSVFALIFAGYDIASGYGIHPITIIYLLALAFSFAFGYIAFRPTSLEAFVRIIGFDFDSKYVWLQLKNREYRERFLEENQMNSEIVNWIVIA
jgi:hypothetical protein